MYPSLPFIYPSLHIYPSPPIIHPSLPLIIFLSTHRCSSVTHPCFVTHEQDPINYLFTHRLLFFYFYFILFFFLPHKSSSRIVTPLFFFFFFSASLPVLQVDWVKNKRERNKIVVRFVEAKNIVYLVIFIL